MYPSTGSSTLRKAVLALALALFCAVPLAAQRQPHTLAQVEELVRFGLSTREILTEVSGTCIDFRMDEQAEARLRQAGASSDLILGLRDVCFRAATQPVVDGRRPDTPGAASPTTPLSLEARIGVAIPTGEFGDGLSPGISLGVRGIYQFTPVIAAVVGFGYSAFGVDDEPEADLDESGFDVGIRATFQTGGPVAPWVQGGLTARTMTVSVGPISVTSDRAIGVFLGGGAELALGTRLALTPGIRYTAYSTETHFQGETFEDDVSFVTADVGLRIRF